MPFALREATDEELDLEFHWTPFDIPRCNDLYSPHMWCRRQRGHTGQCAAGFKAGRRRWDK